MVATLAFSLLAVAQATPQACNNSPALCDRAYDKVTYLGAHDSAFVRNASNGYSLAGNQFFTSPVQLDSGVRMLTSQMHKIGDLTGNPRIHLCHTYCQLYDAGTLSGWLTDIRKWLDKHPNEVITILLVNGDNASIQEINAEFHTARIAHYAYTPKSTTSPPKTWPTLKRLIARNKRLIVFIQPRPASTSTEAKYLLDQFTFTFENNYNVITPTAFSCEADRPAAFANKTSAALASGRLPILNHFLDDRIGNTTIEIPSVENVENTNSPGNSSADGNLGYAAQDCTKVYGKAPTYVLVDFTNAGPAIEAVDRLNGLSEDQIVGRTVLPTQVYNEGPAASQSVASVPSVGPATTNMASATPSPSPGTATAPGM